VARERRQGRTVPDDHRTDVEISLHNDHLPRLADAGVVAYDRRNRTIRYWGTTASKPISRRRTRPARGGLGRGTPSNGASNPSNRRRPELTRGVRRMAGSTRSVGELSASTRRGRWTGRPSDSRRSRPRRR
jgi:hypothetical protein